MALNTILQAIRRGGTSDGATFNLEATEQNDLLVAQGGARYQEITRLGRGWTVQTATPFAAIVGLPTTTAKLEITNGHATRLLVVDRIWSWQLLGTAVVWAHTPWAQVGAKVQSAITGLVVYSNSGLASYTSAAGKDIQAAIDQSVVASGWQVFPGSTMPSSLAAATPAGACVGEVAGALVVPPGMSLHVAVTGSVNTASAFHCGAAVHFANATAN